jgi:glycosyltransferase involved in cell wall biosynthesis
LQNEGLPIELVLVEKLPNHEALEVYRTADVIFDQCLIGFHGYFALEAMALGKPVMCYIRKPAEYLLHPEECPIINTHVDTLKEDLRKLISSRHELEQIGQRGRQYVERHFSREAFAGRLHEAYLDLGILKK